MDYGFINNIVKEKGLSMYGFSNEEIKLVSDCCNEVLNFCKDNKVEFDETAATVFIAHLTTLYERVKKNDFASINSDIFDQIGDELFDMAEKVTAIIKKYYKHDITKDEIFLIASHIGAMKERLKEGGDTK
ncbi:MAG TPA: hypothetical protein DD429_07260 [Clostridiaceae bacterium]|jgi:transcriptional antiterminator|nr:hypothetical protein [Clostridiaceae bacterium]